MNIIFYGGHHWEDAWFRKQQFAKRFSEKGHRVFYVEQSKSMIRLNKNDKNKLFKTKVEKINDNLYIVSPSAIFPFPYKKTIRKWYNKKIFFDIKSYLRKLGANDYILWINRFDFINNLSDIKAIKIIDVCDDIPFYHKLANDEAKYNSSLETFESVFSGSNGIIVSAAKIKEKYKKFTDKEIIVIPNGHDINNPDKDLLVPQELLEIPSPRIGFLGTLFQFIDDELLEYIIKSRPNYNFVFLGMVQANFPIDKIKNYKNVFILGKKNKEQVQNFIKGFDITINPFKIHEVNDSVSPVKVFEYLALKKIVISTKMYSLEKENIAKYIEFADNYNDFLNKLDYHVENNKLENNIPNEILQQYSWDGLFNKLIKNINVKYKIDL